MSILSFLCGRPIRDGLTIRITGQFLTQCESHSQPFALPLRLNEKCKLCALGALGTLIAELPTGETESIFCKDVVNGCGAGGVGQPGIRGDCGIAEVRGGAKRDRVCTRSQGSVSGG